jgi:hypothetical protein
VILPEPMYLTSSLSPPRHHSNSNQLLDQETQHVRLSWQQLAKSAANNNIILSPRCNQFQTHPLTVSREDFSAESALNFPLSTWQIPALDGTSWKGFCKGSPLPSKFFLGRTDTCMITTQYPVPPLQLELNWRFGASVLPQPILRAL